MINRIEQETNELTLTCDYWREGHPGYEGSDYYCMELATRFWRQRFENGRFCIWARCEAHPVTIRTDQPRNDVWRGCNDEPFTFGKDDIVDEITLDELKDLLRVDNVMST